MVFETKATQETLEFTLSSAARAIDVRDVPCATGGRIP